MEIWDWAGISTPIAEAVSLPPRPLAFHDVQARGFQAKSYTRPTDSSTRQTPPAARGSRADRSLHDRHDGTQTATQGRLCGRGDADLKNAAETARYKAWRPTFHDRQTAKQRTRGQPDRQPDGFTRSKPVKILKIHCKTVKIGRDGAKLKSLKSGFLIKNPEK